MTVTSRARIDAAQLFQALSDPTRLQILERLRGGERCVCELMDALDAAQSRLSFHLKTLKDAGLVSDRREGRWVHYAIRREGLEELASLLRELTPAPGRSGTARAAACCD